MVESAGRISRARAQLDAARTVLRHAADALTQLADSLENTFAEAVRLIERCRGNTLVIGMGKAGLVGQKLSATLASTGTRSHFVHPAEAIHGDLGRIGPDDVVIMLSHSGSTEEIVRLLPFLAEIQVPVIAITANSESHLGKRATLTISLGDVEEAGTLKLAPSTSTTAMMALGDALALVVSEARKFRPEDFARFHPGGSLGQQLTRVEDVMRPLPQCRIGTTDETVREVLVRVGQPGRRTGAIMLVNQHGALRGIFTDSDLARLFEFRRDDLIDGPIERVMTQDPVMICRGSFLREAVEIMSDARISELPIVDELGKPCGMIDVTDVLTSPPEWTICERHDYAFDSDIDIEESAGDSHVGPDTIPFVRPGKSTKAN